MEISVVGDFKKGKELMKRLRSENTKRIKQLEREHRKLKALPPK